MPQHDGRCWTGHRAFGAGARMTGTPPSGPARAERCCFRLRGPTCRATWSSAPIASKQHSHRDTGSVSATAPSSEEAGRSFEGRLSEMRSLGYDERGNVTLTTSPVASQAPGNLVQT